MKKLEMKEEENKWRAEEDARTLIEYQKVFQDRERLKKAKEKLKERE